jgi:hypothetical protein
MANEVYCPFCEKEYRDAWDLFEPNDAEAVAVCFRCEKSFTIERVIMIEFRVKNGAAKPDESGEQK